MQVFTLSKRDIEQLIDYNEIIDAVEQSFADYSSGKAVIPPVTNLDIVDANGEVHIKSGHINACDNYCIKIASGFYDNPKRGLPSGNGMMILFDASTGELRGLLFDEGFLTDLRTAAAGAVAAKYLAKESVTAVGILGTGIQARLQMIFLTHVCKFQILYIWGRRLEAVSTYQQDMCSKLSGIDIVACASPSEVAENAEILVTATPTRTPLIWKSDLHPGLHITALGSDGPDKQEIGADAFTVFDKVIVDHLAQCSRLGELHHALDKGMITAEKVYAEIGDIVLGSKAGRESESEITLSDLTGVAVQDIAIANWAMRKAKENNLGKFVEF